MADRQVIQEIKEKLDIADVVKDYVQLKSSGRNLFGVCPFHNEKSPSFSVNSELGIFKCFGCGVSGDVISFIEKIEGVEFPEALRIAADKAGIRIEETKYNPQLDKIQKEKDEIFKLNELASKYFHFVLTKHKSGESAMKYLKARKIDAKSIETFTLGYAPNQWNTLKNFLNSRKYTDSILVKAGLLVSKNNHTYDKFRGRVMFPLFDERGRVVGFSGRVLDTETQKPKYLNSPETPVFTKSKFLFGLYQAKSEMRSKGFCILAEGPTDVINSYRVGVENICAPQGTSLTKDQLHLIHRYCDTVYFCFDQDVAGQTALRRGVDLALAEGFKIKVVGLEGVKDADELIQKDPKEWKKRVDSAQNFVEYYIDKLVEKYNSRTVEGRVKIVDEVIPFISNLKSEVEKDQYLKDLSFRLNIDFETLQAQLPNINNLQKLNIEIRKDLTLKDSRVLEDRRAEYLLSILLQVEPKCRKKILNEVKDVFLETQNVEILSFIKKSVKKDVKGLAELLENESYDNIREKVQTLLLQDVGNIIEDEDRVAKEVENLTSLMRASNIKQELKKLQIEISIAEKRGDDKLVDKLSNQLASLTKQLIK